ncbi:hypothetical protein M3Y97_00028700 [Aphelenchoides bicaudatus]|nr:hypothetical protein M3Y97_00028700 [Aphelenchoides bicaudatus]
MAFRLGLAQPGGFGGPPPRAPFGNFRMQFRPGFKPQNGSDSTGQVEQNLKPSNDSGILFISNIDEKCPNDLMKDMLDVFGKVEKWTRIQGTDGRFPPFGFCGYEEHSAAINAVLTLNNFCIGEKRLNAKADEKTKSTLVEFVIKDRIAKRLPRKTLGKELEADVSDHEQVKAFRAKLREILRTRVPELVHDEDDDLVVNDEKAKSPADATNKHDAERSKKKRRKRSHSRSKRSRSRSQSKSNKAKKSKKRRRSSSTHSSGSSRTNSDRGRRSKNRESSTESHIKGLDSDDSDVVMDRKERKREQRRKDEDYLRVLKRFEERERRMAKQYEQEEDEGRSRKKSQHKEAKKLAQFLEDYDDSRDDNKYYKESMFDKRRRDYASELKADNQDREEEAKEIEAITTMILSEKADAAKRGKLENGNHSPKQKPKLFQQTFQYSFIEEKAATDTPQSNGNEWSPVYEKPSTSSQPTESSKPQGVTKLLTTFQNKVLSQVNSVFAEDDPDEDHTHVIKKKIKPFEITAQDRIESLTAEERKQMVKELIDAIPTSKAAVFDYQLSWDFVDTEMLEQKIKPWLEKKIRDYIGDDEPSLIEFICERINNRSEPSKLLNDLAMILDNEAENFTLKLWRLLIFQTEAKKVGINKQ